MAKQSPKKRSKKKRSKENHLRPREREILQLAETGIVTAEIVHRRFLPEGDIEAARSAIRRLTDLGHLQAEPLDTQRAYYRLTTRGARLIAASCKCAQPHKRQGKIQRYAVSWFIHADRPGERALLNLADYPEQFPVAGHRLPRCPFFLDRIDGRSRLGVILVDHNAHQRRISSKAVKLLGRFLHHGWFDTFIRQDAFVVAILTFSKCRKRAFQRHVPRAIAEHLRYPLSKLRPDLAGAAPSLVDIHVIAQLDSLVTQPRERSSKP
jgi:DNA-binding CsgD family transcriptional regulator